jgi:hypothetical protein
MVEQEQRLWFPLTVGLLIVAWALNVWAPVAMLKPMWGGTAQYADMGSDAKDLPPPAPPSSALPITAIVLAAIACLISVRQMYDERFLGGRWLWIAAASISAILVSWFVLKSLQRAAERFDELYAALPM